MPMVFWDWARDGWAMQQNLYHYLLDRSVCPRCPDTSGRHNFEQRHTEVDGVIGDYYICEYCGKSAGEILPDAYDNMVSAMPATVVTDDGLLIWKPEIHELLSSPASQANGIMISNGLPVTSNGETVAGPMRGERYVGLTE